jgi:tight adherence protein B
VVRVTPWAAAAAAASTAVTLLAARAALRRPATPVHRSTAAPPAPVLAPPWLQAAAHDLAWPVDPTVVWRAGLVAALALVGTVGLLGGAPGALVVATGVAAILRAVRAALARRTRARRDAQLPGALERVASGLRAGSSLAACVADVASTTVPPLGPELQAVAHQVRHGAGITAALERWSACPPASDEVRLAATALALGSTSGGEVARSLDLVAATLRERRQLAAEVRALATQARSSAAVLVLAPPAFTVVVSTVEPAVPRFLLASVPGLACLATGVALEVAGGAWMARILRSAR